MNNTTSVPQINYSQQLLYLFMGFLLIIMI